MRFMTIDLETSIKNRGEGAIGDFKASPYHPANKVVVTGYCIGNRDGVSILDGSPVFSLETSLEPTLFVGQNIGFDLQYLWKEGSISTIDRNVYIWDIGHVEYLLSGQSHTYPSLDEMAAKYGLPLKPDKIKAYWEDGVDTELIPRDELADYLRHDVETTRAIFFKQWEQVCDDEKLLNLIRIKMDDILCTTLMEYNGMAFDKDATLWEMMDVNKELHALEERMRDAAKMHGWPEEVVFDPAKNEHVSALLFGGWLKFDVQVPVLNPDGTEAVYKTGPKKGTKKTKKGESSLLYSGLIPGHGKPTKKDGVFKVGDEELTPLVHWKGVPELLSWRALKKHLSTYVIGYSELVWPDGRIHPSINHSATRTGRQSCTKPNLQNVTSAED